MKTYLELKALSKDERETELKESAEIAAHTSEARGLMQKSTGKLLAVMSIAGEIEKGDFAKAAKEITKRDIRKDLQNVYELAKVFDLVVNGPEKLTEEEYDTCDGAKLALLALFMTEERRPLLPQAIKLVKTGTAKQIRELKGAPEEPKKVREAKEAQATAEKAKEAAEKAKEAAEARIQELEKTLEAYSVPVGFAATDIKADEALATSRQFKDRAKADLIRAIENQDGDTLDTIQDVFGSVFMVACAALDADPLDFVADYLAAKATPAAGQTVETPALAAA